MAFNIETSLMYMRKMRTRHFSVGGLVTKNVSYTISEDFKTITLQKHAYLNILKILFTSKKGKFSDKKKSCIFYIFLLKT